MNNDRNKKIEDILGSLDNHPKAGVPDFFYTRLKARMEAGVEAPVVKRSWVLRPVFALTALVAVLVINAFVIFQKNNSPENNNDADTLQSIAAEYSLNDNNTILFDINQDK